MINEEKRLIEEIINFISNQTGYNKNKIGLSTDLGKDIGLDGDDAEEFFIAFFEKFNIDHSNFIISRYFGPEAAFNPILYLYYLIFKKEALDKAPIMVSDLVSAAKQKQWI